MITIIFSSKINRKIDNKIFIDQIEKRGSFLSCRTVEIICTYAQYFCVYDNKRKTVA